MDRSLPWGVARQISRLLRMNRPARSRQTMQSTTGQAFSWDLRKSAAFKAVRGLLEPERKVEGQRGRQRGRTGLAGASQTALDYVVCSSARGPECPSDIEAQEHSYTLAAG